MPGIKIRKMKTQFDTTHGTTFINLEDVKVPVRNLIGQEGGQRWDSMHLYCPVCSQSYAIDSGVVSF